MKKIVLLVLVAGGAVWAWRAYTASQAFGAYEGFAESWAKEDRVKAERFAAGPDVVKHAFDDRALRGNRGGAAMEAFRGTSYDVESRAADGDGQVKLVVMQTIRFDPPGATTGIGGAMWARYRDEATVKKTAGGWRVTAFEPTFVDLGEVKRR
jgi:hypothetical protein